MPSMKPTKSEIWDGYIRAMLPSIADRSEATREGVVAALVLTADELLAARQERFGEVEMPVVASEEKEADPQKEALVLELFERDEAWSGLRGPEVGRMLRGKVEGNEVYEVLQGLVEQGLLWVELDRVKDRAFGKEQESNVVTYLHPGWLNKYDSSHYKKMEAAGGVLVSERYDVKRMPAWVKRVMRNIAAVKGGAK